MIAKRTVVPGLVRGEEMRIVAHELADLHCFDEMVHKLILSQVCIFRPHDAQPRVEVVSLSAF